MNLSATFVTQNFIAKIVTWLADNEHACVHKYPPLLEQFVSCNLYYIAS